MFKFFKSLPYHIKSAFKNIKRNIAMSISSASAVTLTLIMVMLFLFVAGNVMNFADNIEDSLKIHVNISLDQTKDDEQRILQSIKAIPHVTKVQFSSKDEQFQLLIKDKEEKYKELYQNIIEEGNPLYDVYIVEVRYGNDLKSVASSIEQIEGVENANYGGESAIKLVNTLQSLQTGGLIFVAALSFLALFLISNTIKLTIYARKSEIAIMRNVGATNGFVKTPFMIEGIIIGFMGSILPIILTLVGYRLLYEKLNGELFSSVFALQPFYPFAWWVSLILLIGGILVGFVGSFVSVTKYLRFKR